MAKNSKKFFFLFSLIFLLLLPFLVKAQGGGPFAFVGYLFSSIFKLYEAGVLFLFFLQLIILIGGSINGFFALGITLVLSPGLIQNWSYTQNPFVDAGLEITQGFISIGLVLALIWIAFATILRLEGYDTKRLLIRLIIAALLVYFSRVICGLIVDASNVFMYYFSDKILGIGILTNNLITAGRRFLETLAAIVNPLAWPREIAESIVLISVQFYLATLLISFFLLFLFRYAAIWIAVILAPIAFVCWILPPTRRYWEEWWKNFIQWCLAGPISAFFLYLAARAGEEIARPGPGGRSLAQQLAEVFTQWRNLAPIIPHFFTIGLLQLGIIYGIKGAGWGGEMALRWARRGTHWAAGKLAAWRLTPTTAFQRAWMAPLGTTLGPILGTERIERWRQRMEQMGIREATLALPGEGEPGIRGFLRRTAAYPVWAVRRRIGHVFGPAQLEYEKTLVESKEKEISGKGVETQVEAYRKARSSTERLGILRAIIRDKNIERAMDVTRFGANAIQLTEIPQLYQLAARLEREDLLRAAFPEIARNHLRALPPGTPGAPPLPVLSPDLSPQDRAREIQLHYARAALERTRANDFENMTSRVLRDDIFLEALVTAGTPEQFEAFVRRFGPRGSEAFRDALINASLRYGRPAVTFLRDRNPILFQYLRRPGRASRLLTPEITSALLAYSPTQTPPGQPPPTQPPGPPSPPPSPPPPSPPPQAQPPRPPSPPSSWPTPKPSQPTTKPSSPLQTPSTGSSTKKSTESGFGRYRTRRSAPRPGPFE